MCFKCIRYRLALAFKQFGNVSHWMLTGNSRFVFTVQLLVLFPEGQNPLLLFFRTHTFILVIKGKPFTH